VEVEQRKRARQYQDVILEDMRNNIF